MKRMFLLGASILATTAAFAMGDRLPDTGTTRLYDNPERVTLRGYVGVAMEPFITRDGRYLLFNNSNDPAVDTNLHWAERVDELAFDYRGEIEGVNTPALEGVASLDRQGMLYFVSTRSYAKSLATLYRGSFVNGRVSALELVPGVSRMEPGRVNFDAEVSADGATLYFVDGRFDGGPVPKSADIVIAQREGKGFRRRADSERIMHNVNSAVLDYAPCISADELSMFFTRMRNGMGASPAIYMARRGSTDEPFGPPLRLEAIEGFVEAPALSADEKSLYYHRREGGGFVLYRVTRQ